jgi:hypothetical protein
MTRTLTTAGTVLRVGDHWISESEEFSLGAVGDNLLFTVKNYLKLGFITTHAIGPA